MKRTEKGTGKSTDCPADSEVLVSLASLVGTYGLSQPRDSVLRDSEDRIEEERPTCHLHKGQKVGDSMSSMCECVCVCVCSDGENSPVTMTYTNTYTVHMLVYKKREKKKKREHMLTHSYTQTFRCKQTLANIRTSTHTHADRDILTDTDLMSLLSLQLPEQPSRKPRPQIRSMCLCVCSFSPLSITYHWGGSASQGIILSDIWVSLLSSVQETRPSRQPQNGSFGFDAISITSSCL